MQSDSIEFQKGVAAALLRNPDWLLQLTEDDRSCLRFAYPPLRDLWALLEQSLKNRQIPSSGELEDLVLRHKADGATVQAELRGLVQELQTKDFTDYTKQKLYDYLAWQRFDRYRLSINSISDPSQLQEKMGELIRVVNVLPYKIGETAEKRGWNPFKNKDHWIEHVNDSYQGRPLRLGFPLLDERIGGGGMYPGDLAIFMAPTGGGKTMFLLNVAHNTMLQGAKVHYFFLDNSRGDIDERFGCLVAKVPFGKPHDIEDQRRVCVALEKLQDLGGAIYFEEMVAKRTRVSDISAAITRLSRDEFVPDVVIIDYGDLIQAEHRYNELRHELSDTFTDFRNLGKLHKTRVYTATQANRQALTAKLIGLEHTSEAYNKMFPASLVGALCQTDAQRDLGQCTLAICKCSRGPKNYGVPLLWVPEHQHIYQSSATTVTVSFDDMQHGVSGTDRPTVVAAPPVRQGLATPPAPREWKSKFE